MVHGASTLISTFFIFGFCNYHVAPAPSGEKGINYKKIPCFYSTLFQHLSIHFNMVYGFFLWIIYFNIGCMEKVPGCWEHLSMVWLALKEARTQKSSLCTVWVDIANPYGSIPHMLIPRIQWPLLIYEIPVLSNQIRTKSFSFS